MLFFAWLHLPISAGATGSRKLFRIFQGIDGWELTLLSTYTVLGVYTHQLIEVSHPLLSKNDCLFFF